MEFSATQYRKLRIKINLLPGYDLQTNLFQLRTLYLQGRIQKMELGTKSGGLGRKSPSGVQGRSPGMGCGDGIPQKLEHLKKYTT